MKDLIWAVLIILPSLTMQEDCLKPNQSVTASQSLCKFFSPGELKLSLKMSGMVHNLNPGKNFFFSPYGVYNSLLLAYFISKGSTSQAIERLLKLEGMHKGYTLAVYKMIRQMRSDYQEKETNVKFALANRVYLSKSETPIQCMKDHLGPEFETMNFTRQPVARINEFVANVTMKQIKNFLSEGSLNADTKLVLVNAAYFKGTWNTKFRKQDTKKETFSISQTESTPVQMMMLDSKFNHSYYYNLEGTRIVQLPYVGGEFSMYLVLPPLGMYNLSTVFEKLSAKALKRAIETASPLQIEVKLPKFTFESQLDLVPVLQNMKAGILFGSTSDLSGLTGKRDIHLNSAIHTAKISLDEDGTTAAAATAVYNFRATSIERRFHCNRPFVYFIYHHRSMNILFIGGYNRPEMDT